MTAKPKNLLEAELTESVIGSFFDAYGELGFGYREYIYALALERDLVAKGHRVERELSVMVYFRGHPLARQTLDMIVDGRLVVETKSTERLRANATQQLFSYLHATNLQVGLLLHFGPEPKFYRVIYENRLKLRRT
ncbi:MAG TPA: GxxExxY protein [Gemmatimonadaceae bacterium]|jgi:GxxExxY protein|nr:GxxExxY protein [Gemmatimonadaceae bacterium]